MSINHHGNFCFQCTFEEIASVNKDQFLEEMIRNSILVCDEEPNDAQCRAWINCQKILSKTVKHLPEEYKTCWLVFEYVLPQHKPGTKKFDKETGIRPDVLVVGKDFVTVLEFKQRKLDSDNSVYFGYISQAQKYVRRLNKYHSLSKDKYVAPIVVLALEKNYLEDSGDYIACSADRLSDALVLLNGQHPQTLSHKQFVDWLCDSQL